MRRGLEVDDHRDGGTAVVALTGELDVATALRLQRTLARLIADDATSKLTLDLSQLTFIDSSGLAAIVYASRLCERHDCELSVIRGSDAVHSVFEMTGLAEHLPFSPG
ncbi:MAG TPA: STAS domain-containing protein [Solirubrobacteraceae bacterium]|jgi:anti-sigma B factor antagonist|nr:STAS domain-containing protein [Solirubrobacteraceae bacterium]